MKKVLIVTPFLEKVGGVETVTQLLAELLKKKGFDVEFLTADEGPSGLWERIMVKIIGLPYLTQKKYKRFNEKEYIAVICNGEFGLGINHPKAISYFHGSYYGLRLHTHGQLSFWHQMVLSFRSWQQVLSVKNKRVISVSHFLKNILKEQGISVDEVITNPLDLDFFSPQKADEKGDLVFFGRFDYWGKGFDRLQFLSENGIQVTCYTDREKHTQSLKTLPMVPHKKIPSEMAKYKVLIFPTRFESYGMVIAEAMAMGLPVLTSPVGLGHDLQNIIPDYVVTDFFNITEVKNKLSQIHSNYDFYSEKSREYAITNFSIDKFSSAWEIIINA
jgi:glycosyltransferase involved in cell wall biosynthesis